MACESDPKLKVALFLLFVVVTCLVIFMQRSSLNISSMLLGIYQRNTKHLLTFTYTKNLPPLFSQLFLWISSLNSQTVIKYILPIFLHFYLKWVPDGSLMKKKRMEGSHILPIIVSINEWPVLFHHKWKKEGAKVKSFNMFTF